MFTLESDLVGLRLAIKKFYRNVFVLGDASAVIAEGPERDGLVDEEPQLVLALQLDHPLHRTNLAGVEVDSLHHEKLAPNLG